MKKAVKTKRAPKNGAAKKRSTVGARIVEGLEQAIAWSRGENVRARVTQI
jgi:hypothetical protein